jgi:hypothetical protein
MGQFESRKDDHAVLIFLVFLSHRKSVEFFALLLRVREMRYLYLGLAAVFHGFIKS